MSSREGQHEIAEAITRLEDITLGHVLSSQAAANEANQAANRAEGSAVLADNFYQSMMDSYGYPFTAPTAAAMTDRSKIYVYVGNESGYVNGNWYYHNGTAWVSGGAFNSTGDLTKALSEMALFNVDDLLWEHCNPVSKTAAGVTWTVNNNNKTVSVTGTATGITFINFYNTGAGDTGIPSWLTKGKKYYAAIHTSSRVVLQIAYYIDNTATWINVQNYDSFVIPNEADDNRFVIRLAILSTNLGSVNTIVRPRISKALSLTELEEQIEGQNDIVMKKYPSNTIPSNTDLNDLTDTGYQLLSRGNTYSNCPINMARQGALIRIYNTGTVVTQLIDGLVDSVKWIRRYFQNEWSEWQSADNTKLSKSEASLFGVEDLLWNGANFDEGLSKTTNGVTFTTDKGNKTINVSGMATASPTFYRLFFDGATIMPTLTVGKKYIAHINSKNVYLRLYAAVDGLGNAVKIVETKTKQAFILPEDTQRISVRLDVLEGTVVDEDVHPFISEAMSLQELTENAYSKSLKILFLGHSTVQDELTYVPWILQNVAPELNLTMGIGYKSGTNISGTNGYNAGFDDPSYTFGIYSIYEQNGNAWANQSNSVTIKQALDDKDWDVIVLTESAWFTSEKTPSDDTTHFEVLGEFIDKVVNYVKKPIKIGVFFNHNRFATNSGVQIETETSYEETIEQYQTNILNKYAAVQFFFPNLTAYWNARGTVLDQYGNAEWHHMLADYAHYQEGIGCYLGSCCSVLTILDIAGINNRSILGEQTRPNLAWVTEKNIPGKNPSSGITVVGISDANCLIAQKCAIAAYKKPFEISTIV